ncbi:MAG: ribosome maturation factor RimP [Velocimicrobium sp.]
MSISREYEERTEQLLLPIMQENGYELVDVEYVKEAGNCFLRAFVDKEGGITIDDCEIVSRALSDLLDQNDFISDAYILEVSSPGLGRQLKKDKDFIRSIGQDIDIKLYKNMKFMLQGKEVSVKEVTGTLKEYNADAIIISLETEETIEISRKDIAIVKLALDF